MKRGTVVFLVALSGAVVMGGIAAWFTYQGNTFVTSDYASVQAPSVWVQQPETAVVRDVLVRPGAHVTKGQVLLQEQTAAGSAITIDAPRAGTVGSVEATSGQTLTAGQPILPIVDLKQADVLAQIQETNVASVHQGQSVDVGLASQPGMTYPATVVHVGAATLAQDSPPALGPYAKAVQWVPVTIRFDVQGVPAVAGESATVRIHR